MYVVAVFIEVKPGRLESFSHAVLKNARLSYDKEPGCNRFDVAIEPLDGSSFFLYEIYDDEAAHGAHRETDHYKQFADLVAPWVEHKRVLTYELLSGPGQA